MPPGPVSDYPGRPSAICRDSPLFSTQTSPSSASARSCEFGSARPEIPASSRREFLSKAPIFLWIPRRRGVSRGAAVEKSLLFADFQGFLQRRVSSSLGAQPIVQSASQDQAASPDRRRRPWGFAAFKASIAQRRRAPTRLVLGTLGFNLFAKKKLILSRLFVQRPFSVALKRNRRQNRHFFRFLSMSQSSPVEKSTGC